MAQRFVLSDFGRSFATRGRGEELRVLLLERASDAETVVIDFARVTRVTYSFADEFVGRLHAEHPGLVAVEHAPPNVAQVLDRAIGRRTGSYAC